jgi:hypothetical protein
MHFGRSDKKDFLIPPFAVLYFYIVFAAAFGFRPVSQQEFFDSEIISWVGVLLCLVGLMLELWSLVSFGRSFRVGIDTHHPDKLVTAGIFRVSRNPILCGIRVYPNWPIPDLRKLDSSGLSRRSDLAVSPSSLTRRRVPEDSLRPRIRRVLQPSASVFVNDGRLDKRHRRLSPLAKAGNSADCVAHQSTSKMISVPPPAPSLSADVAPPTSRRRQRLRQIADSRPRCRRCALPRPPAPAGRTRTGSRRHSLSTDTRA